jgi:hypothetical protein
LSTPARRLRSAHGKRPPSSRDQPRFLANQIEIKGGVRAARKEEIVKTKHIGVIVALVCVAGCGPKKLSPAEVVGAFTAAGFKTELDSGSYMKKFADEDQTLFFALDDVDYLGLRFKTTTEASDWCQTRKRCVAVAYWSIDADQRTLSDQPFPADRIRAALVAK